MTGLTGAYPAMVRVSWWMRAGRCGLAARWGLRPEPVKCLPLNWPFTSTAVALCAAARSTCTAACPGLTGCSGWMWVLARCWARGCRARQLCAVSMCATTADACWAVAPHSLGCGGPCQAGACWAGALPCHPCPGCLNWHTALFYPFGRGFSGWPEAGGATWAIRRGDQRLATGDYLLPCLLPRHEWLEGGADVRHTDVAPVLWSS